MPIRTTGSTSLDFSIEELHLKRTDFDKKSFRPKLREIGKIVRKSARKKVARTVVSDPGTYPGKRTGKLRKAIKYKLFRSGYGVVVFQDVPDSTKEFYPAFLRYGTKKRKRGGTLEKRKDYVADTMKEHDDLAMQLVLEGLEDSLKGIFEK